MVAKHYGLSHISTGDILRDNVKKGTELGMTAKEYMDAGRLVPSNLIVQLVKQQLLLHEERSRGCLLDGFPRTSEQAEAMLEAGMDVDKFILIEVPDDALVERGCGRRLDPNSGKIYHLKFNPPPKEILSRLLHRSDDREEQIRNRLDIYHKQIGAILPYFDGKISRVDGTKQRDEVFQTIVCFLLGGTRGDIALERISAARPSITKVDR